MRQPQHRFVADHGRGISSSLGIRERSVDYDPPSPGPSGVNLMTGCCLSCWTFRTTPAVVPSTGSCRRRPQARSDARLPYSINVPDDPPRRLAGVVRPQRDLAADFSHVALEYQREIAPSHSADSSPDSGSDSRADTTARPRVDDALGCARAQARSSRNFLRSGLPSLLVAITSTSRFVGTRHDSAAHILRRGAAAAHCGRTGIEPIRRRVPRQPVSASVRAL